MDIAEPKNLAALENLFGPTNWRISSALLSLRFQLLPLPKSPIFFKVFFSGACLHASMQFDRGARKANER